MKAQTKHRSDYQTDIYEAKVKIAIARWKTGIVPRENTQSEQVSREKC